MKTPSAPSATRPIEAAAADWIVRRDGGLSAGAQAEFAAWLAADPRHAAAVARMDETWGRLDRPRAAGHATAMLEKFSASAARRRRRRLTATGGALALLLLAGVIWRGQPVASRAESAPQPGVSAKVVRPEARTLADGSTVELRSGAEIAVEFTPALRRVALLRGEAHFQVAKDAARPFVVAAGGAEVRAVGTAFAVEFAGSGVEVVVTEGRVRVTLAAAAAPEISLGANERVSLPGAVAASPIAAVDAAELAERLAWRGARLEFTDTPLHEAVALMNRHAAGENPVRLVVADAELARRPVTGLFRADNRETFVRLLEVSLGVRAERAGDTITLRRGR